VLDRNIAARNRYPAVDILRSLSRTMPGCNSDEENALVSKARRLMATYENMAELIRLGAYRAGSDPEVDEAIRYHDQLEAFLRQGKTEKASLASCYRALDEILALKAPPAAAPAAPAAKPAAKAAAKSGAGARAA
jgi:flagellum-specific ATP synthase